MRTNVRFMIKSSIRLGADVNSLGPAAIIRRDLNSTPLLALLRHGKRGRSGLPLLAFCSNGHRRMIPFRLLKTGDDDRTPLYGRPFKCKACGSLEPPRVFRRLFGLSHAAMAGWSSVA
jgi:hypothetical protein